VRLGNPWKLCMFIYSTLHRYYSKEAVGLGMSI
jgi:hypothetical protein